MKTYINTTTNKQTGGDQVVFTGFGLSWNQFMVPGKNLLIYGKICILFSWITLHTPYLRSWYFSQVARAQGCCLGPWNLSHLQASWTSCQKPKWQGKRSLPVSLSLSKIQMAKWASGDIRIIIQFSNQITFNCNVCFQVPTLVHGEVVMWDSCAIMLQFWFAKKQKFIKNNPLNFFD